MKAGLPTPQVPAFSTWDPVHNHTMSFSEMTAALGAGVGIIPLLAVIESVAIAKAFGEWTGREDHGDCEVSGGVEAPIVLDVDDDP